MTDLREIPFASVCNRSNLGIFFASSPIIFQAGYFSEIGIEYLSFMSIGQAIVNSLLIAPVIPVILWIAAYTWEGILDRVRSGETPSDYKLLRYWNFVERPKTLFIIIYLILLISYAENYLDLGNYRVSSKVSEFIFLASMANGWIIVVWLVSLLRHHADIDGLVYRRNVVQLVLLLPILIYFSGSIYAEYFSGKDCLIEADGKTEEARFLVSSGDMIIFQYEAGTAAINKSIVTRISCQSKVSQKTDIKKQYGPPVFY